MKKIFYLLFLFLFIILYLSPQFVLAQECCPSAINCVVDTSCGSNQCRCRPHAGTNYCMPWQCAGGQMCNANVCEGSSSVPPETRDSVEIICGTSMHGTPCTDCVRAFRTYTAIGCIPTDNVMATIGWFSGKLLLIVGGLAMLLMIFGALQVILSAGDTNKVTAGQQMFTSALAGLIFSILALFLLHLIGVEVLQIPGFS